MPLTQIRVPERFGFAKTAAWIDGRSVWIFVATLPFYAVFAWVVAHGHAFVADENSVLMQSRIFAAGHLAGAVPPDLIDLIVPGKYQGYALHVSHARGTLASSYWPGFALLLTPFSLLGVPWLCNPVLTSLTMWVLHRVTRLFTSSPDAALWALIFAVSSPVIALNAAAYFSMPAHLLFNLVFCWLIFARTRRAAFFAGVVGGFAMILHNPVPHAFFALPWMIWMARRRRDLLGPLLCGYCVFAPLIGIGWNSYLHSFDAPTLAPGGAPLVSTVSQGLFRDTLHRVSLGFAWPDHNLWINRLAGTCKLILWATPGLALLAWMGAVRSKNSLKEIAREQPFLWLIVCSFVSTCIAYVFVPFEQGAGWGFRYIHSAWMTLPVLSAWFLMGVSSPMLRRYFVAVAALSCLILIPFRGFQAEKFLSRHSTQIPVSPTSPSLTFIELKRGYRTIDLVQNDPFFRHSNWKLVSRGAAQNEAVARRVLIAPRLEKRENWGEIWVGEGFTPRYARWSRDSK